MEDDVNSKCGFFVGHTLHDTHSGLKALEPRGREATGIAGIGYDGRIDVVKWIGSPRRFGVEDLHYIFPGNNYHTFIGHVRYATRGEKERLLPDSHPHVVGGTMINRGSHVIILDADATAAHNGQIDDRFFDRVDRRKLKTGCDTEAGLHLFREIGEREFLRTVPGSYVFAVADKKHKGVMVMRDRLGIKPAVLGWKDGKYIAASEDSALQAIGANFVEAIRPGTVVHFDPNGKHSVERVVEPQKLARCFFEWNYIANVLSNLDGVSVDSVRGYLGEQLAEEFPMKDVDFVTFLPRCPEKAAMAYARKLELPFERVFYKLSNERSFMGSNSDERANSIGGNLFLLPRIRDMLAKDFLRRKRVAVVDDSTIRGNNSKRAMNLLYGSGEIAEGTLLNYTAKMCGFGGDGKKRGCHQGVDMPIEPAKGDSYVARGENKTRTDEEISKVLGFKTRFSSLDGMLRAFERAGISRESLCTFCVGGKDPLGIN